MRKPRIQRSFAALTEAEINQVAVWLDAETYEQVLVRVRKPRSEGGFGLDLSRSPLERLYAKKKEIDKINQRIASGQKLTLAEYDNITEGEKVPNTRVHNAIMEYALDQAENEELKPTQLLALQRVADFPERAAIREERLELDRLKLEHKIDMDQHRKHIASERLELAKRSQALREQQHEYRQKRDEKRDAQRSAKPADATNLSTTRKEDHLGPLAIDWKDVGKRVQKMFNISDEEAARRRELYKTWKRPPIDDPIPAPTVTNPPAANPDLNAQPQPQPNL